MKSIKKIATVFIVAAVLLTSSILPAFSAENTVMLYGNGASDDGESRMSAGANVLSTRFKFEKGGLTAIIFGELFTETPGQNGTVCIYQWKTDYETTVAAKPAAEQAIEDYTYEVGADCIVKLDNALPAGEYLVTLESDGGIWVWLHAQAAGINCYIDGDEYTHGTFKISYVFDDALQPATDPETPTDKPASPTVQPTAPVKEPSNPSSGDVSSVWIICGAMVLSTFFMGVLRSKKENS